MGYKIFEYDPQLLPFSRDIAQRMKNYANKKRELVGEANSCDDCVLFGQKGRNGDFACASGKIA